MMDLQIKFKKNKYTTSCSLGHVFKEMVESHQAKGCCQMLWNFKEIDEV